MKLTELRNIIREVIAEQFATPEELKKGGLNPDTKNVKAGSIEKDTDLQGRKITKYIKISAKGKETPMISYDDVGQSKLKKYPFVGADPNHEVKLFDRSSEAEKLYKDQLEKQKDNHNLIRRIKEDTSKEIKKIKSQIEQDIEQSMLRRINNYNLISSQMENNLKNEMKKHIMEKAIKYTEIRIKKNLSKKQNLRLVENSIINIPKNFF